MIESPTETGPRALMTYGEAAKLFRISTDSIARMVEDGALDKAELPNLRTRHLTVESALRLVSKLNNPQRPGPSAARS